MAKRVAAGATPVSVWTDEPDLSLRRARITAIAPRKNPHHLRQAVVLGLCTFAVLSFVSYAAYAHQWSELSALRHLGEAPLSHGALGRG